MTTSEQLSSGQQDQGAQESAGASSPSGRRLALDVHARLRTMILSGELAPGSSLLQAEMARRLEVSRTPMREAFRLLQEEGLIEASPDQRARVRAVDPDDVDSVYGARVQLETLAVSVTARTAGEGEIAGLRAALESMRANTGHDGDIEQWYFAHREFHRIATGAVADHVQRLLTSLSERSERYIRLAQLGTDASWGRGDHDHEALISAFQDRDEQAAQQVIARHLARTALTVMADIAPSREPIMTRTALRISGLDGTD